MRKLFEGKVLEWQNVKTIQPTMNLRWVIPISSDFLPYLQQQWVCLEDGVTEWRKVETVKEGEANGT